MELYFGKRSDNNKIILDETESNHLINVRRAHSGEVVHVTDGEGNLFVAKLLTNEKRQCILEITDVTESFRKPYHLHIAIAPTKSIERMEWFLEKATETGIDEVSFLLCRHSERKEIKEERLRRVIVSSMKQSLKTFYPKINAITDFKTFVAKKYSGNTIICTMNADKDGSFRNNYRPGNNLTALIGPEGDFHPDELKHAIDNGFRPSSLGTSRLRTETAALSVCTLFNFLNSQ